LPITGSELRPIYEYQGCRAFTFALARFCWLVRHGGRGPQLSVLWGGNILGSASPSKEIFRMLIAIKLLEKIHPRQECRMRHGLGSA